MRLLGPFAFSKNWLALIGAVSLQPERFFKMSKCHNILSSLQLQKMTLEKKPISLCGGVIESNKKFGEIGSEK